MNGSELFSQYLEFLQEGRNVEYKESTGWTENDFKAKITKSILALSNVRDGGIIIIGIKQQPDNTYIKQGVTEEHYNTYNSDHIKKHVSKYADPYVKFEVYKESLDGKKYIFIKISEFDEIPIICKKDYNSTKSKVILRNGATYTRSYDMPESIEVPSQSEMREILDNATVKRVRKLLEMNRRSGIKMVPELSDKDKFEIQMGELINNE